MRFLQRRNLRFGHGQRCEDGLGRVLQVRRWKDKAEERLNRFIRLGAYAGHGSVQRDALDAKGDYVAQVDTCKFLRRVQHRYFRALNGRIKERAAADNRFTLQQFISIGESKLEVTAVFLRVPLLSPVDSAARR